MATSFADLKKNRKQSLTKLTDKLKTADQKQQNNFASDQDKFWTLTVDKTGNGKATIRFLPAPAGEEDAYVRTFSHAFQGPTGMWYIENSLATVGKEDPVAELNRTLWNTGLEVNRNKARAQKRRLNYYSNILVVSDPANPENEGKVFLFKYGKSIFDMLQHAAIPPEQDPDEDTYTDTVCPWRTSADEGFDPFCLWEGADLNLRATIDTKTKMRTYEKSKFSKPTPVAEKEAVAEGIWSQCHPLAPFIDPENSKMYKSYDQLKTRLNIVTGVAAAAQLPTAQAGAERTADNPLASDESPFVEDDEDREAAEMFRQLAAKS